MVMGNADSSPPSFFSGTTSSFTVLSVAVAGILAFSILLLAYYLFLTKSSSSSSWRRGLLTLHLDVAATTTVYSPPAPPSRGMEDAAIRRIPTFRYRSTKQQQQQPPLTAPASSSECAVCLTEFRDGERLRLLPPCLHAFHIDCIDAWLHATATCPLCRASTFPSPPPHHHLHIDILHDAADTVSPSPEPGETSTRDEGQQRVHARRNDGDLLLTTGVQQQLMPIRRSLSMDSCGDKYLYLALHKALRQHHNSAALLLGDDGGGKAGEMSSSAGRKRMLRRSFFSFSQGRSWSFRSTAILPI